MKLFISEKTGSIYWLDGDALMFCPLPARNGLIDLDNDGGAVEFDLFEGDTLDDGTLLVDYLNNIKRSFNL